MTTAGDVGSATTGSTAPMVRYGEKPLTRKKPLKGQEKKMKTFREYAKESLEEGAKFKKVKKFVPDKAGNLKKVIKKECQNSEGGKAAGYKIVDGKKCAKMTPAEQKDKAKVMKKVQKTKKKHANKNAKRAEKIKGKKIAKGLISAPTLEESFRNIIIAESKKIYGVTFYSDEEEEHDIGTVYFRAKNNDEAISLASKAKLFKVGSYESIDAYETDGEQAVLDAGYNIEN